MFNFCVVVPQPPPPTHSQNQFFKLLPKFSDQIKVRNYLTITCVVQISKQVIRVRCPNYRGRSPKNKINNATELFKLFFPRYEITQLYSGEPSSTLLRGQKYIHISDTQQFVIARAVSTLQKSVNAQGDQFTSSPSGSRIG